MKTLVIHPEDPSTDFLKDIYKDKDYTVLNTWRSSKEVIKQIKKHDRIMMMGHGSPAGLFNLGFMGYIINSQLVYLLREKHNVAIWCHADRFMNHYGLKGFYTGMFISEVREAQYEKVEATQEEIEYSNKLFATLMHDIIDSPNLLTEIKSTYIGGNKVITFNNERLYFRNGFEKPTGDDGGQLLLIT